MANSNNKPEKKRRLFVGIKVSFSSQIEETVKYLKQELSDYNIKWSSPENYHITSVFIGSVNSIDAEGIHELLLNNINLPERFELALNKVGYFGTNKPRVLWLGVVENSALNEIRSEVVAVLESMDIAIDKEHYFPHVTLGRIKGISETNRFASILRSCPDLLLDTIHIKEIVLYESLSQPEGVQYLPIGRYKLK